MGAKGSKANVSRFMKKEAHRESPEDLRNSLEMVNSLNEKAFLFPSLCTRKILKFSVALAPHMSRVIREDNSARRSEGGGVAEGEVASKDINWSVHVCREGHVMRKLRGLPRSYTGKHKWVYCDRCSRTGLERSAKGFWHCSKCGYDCCLSCSAEKAMRVVVEVVDYKGERPGTVIERGGESKISAPASPRTRSFRLFNRVQFEKVYHEIMKSSGILNDTMTSRILALGDQRSGLDKKTGSCGQKDDEDKVCEICFEESVAVMLNCNHCFCESCLEGWAKNHETCPMCRAPFAENKKHGLGWVLAVQDDDMARAGASMLEKIWGLVESHPIITVESQDFDKFIVELSGANVDEVSRRMSLERVQKLFH
mmetsp:Transcript_1502/g.2843  ORF Transcript_1502/g.2843 Transcript_1502/m.2843 type:complete len:368 (-) Transcript_1502:226-1329(-)|eukprot:CAMPEP_0170171842 /NCGR_PEP_ID=MMETSP0040_2-20121228/5044_1 /TAXON_ID=641309 /ORGANISM="Lotharella oceanica, Strain CCMP622" /LENGTH=367 /DNA_ID=CAMNT_0010412153 /DNA_START=46 /DNA_END=1149 /DNA_ORIENTATION=+